jgi:hypothetical protein
VIASQRLTQRRRNDIIATIGLILGAALDGDAATRAPVSRCNPAMPPAWS